MTHGLSTMAAWTAPSHWRTRPAPEEGDVMRTLRLSLAGTVIVVLLGGLGGAVLAQTETPADGTAAMFTGRLVGSCPVQAPTVEEVDGIRRERGRVYGCFRWETTDPRINGESTVIWNYDTHPATDEVPGGTVGAARERITTETGAWEGTLTQLHIDGVPKLESGWYVGEGEYDGLVFYATLQDDGHSLWGYISQEPPPVPETVPER